MSSFSIKYLKYEYNNITQALIFDSSLKSTGILFNGDIVLNVRNTPTVSIEVISSSPHFNLFNTLKDEILVYQGTDIVFRGRLINIKETYGGKGRSKILTFESIVSALLDVSISDTFAPAGSSLRDLFNFIGPTYFESAKYGIAFDVPVGIEITALTPAEYLERTGSTLKEIIEGLLKNTNYWLKVVNYSSPQGAKQIMTLLKVEELYSESKDVIRLYMDKHVNNLSIDTSLDKLCNEVTIKGNGVSSTKTDTSSINAHTKVMLYKKDDRYTDATSVANYAETLLNRYKNTLTRAEVDYIDYEYLKDNTTLNTIGIGDIVDIVQYSSTQQLQSLYKGYVAEVKYNLFKPYQKQLIIGNVKENLFKEGE